MRDTALLYRQISELTRSGVTVEADEKDYSWLCVRDMQLPPDGVWTNAEGVRVSCISTWISIPDDYPHCGQVIGISHQTYPVHIQPLKYNGRLINDLHNCDHKGWSWLCFQSLEWDPRCDPLDDLINTICISILKRAGYVSRNNYNFFPRR